MPKNLPFALIVLDGWGYREDETNNALASARLPFYRGLLSRYPHAVLDASEKSVGLPEGQVGNSEVGHMTIGAGKILDTDLVRITKSIRDNSFAGNPVFQTLFDHVRKHDSTLHIQGLVSPGGVHSHQEHLYALLHAAKDAGIANVVIHAFTDGRDTAPQSAGQYIKELEGVLQKVGTGKIATISGRFYAMDRDNNWDRVDKAEKAIFECTGRLCAADMTPSEMLEKLYQEGATDEYIEPIVFLDSAGNGYPIKKNDAVAFFNFRADRARMLSKKIHERKEADNLCFATFTEYDSSLSCLVAFPPSKIETTLAAEISRAGLTQAHIAETEKYAHATYFLNGGKEDPHKGEEFILVESRKDIKTHDEAPKMRAKEIADAAIVQIEKGTQFLFINFANADMVGHTANVPATIEAVEEIDLQLSRVLGVLEAKGGVALITADHGNAEMNVHPETGARHTAHTENVVPVILTAIGETISSGTLADVAPTVLSLLGLPVPASMTGRVLAH